MSTVVVDWLGRGGIAQCTEAWGTDLSRRGVAVTVVTRGGRELGQAPLDVVESTDRGGRVASHARLVAAAVREIRSRRPDSVVIQGYVIPALEEPVHRAARAVGARLVLIVHDHRHHSRTSGFRAGLGGQIRRADEVLALSTFVADVVAADTGRRSEVIDHPVQTGMVERHAQLPVADDVDLPLALHFGVLGRGGSKGTDLAVALAEAGVEGWRFAFAGVNAPVVPGVVSHDGFLDGRALVALVAGSAATVLPYRRASQSGAVVLAQALGSVPVVSDVGGLAEQVGHGTTGVVLGAGDDTEGWRRALADLDPGRRRALAEAAHRSVWVAHDRSVDRIHDLVAGA